MQTQSLSIAIIYFSGTGNTEYVTNQIKKDFEQKGNKVDTFRLEDILKNYLKLDVDKYDVFGVGSAIHAFNFPKIFLKYISNEMPDGMNKPVFIFKSAGDCLGNGGSTTMVRKRLLKKNYRVIMERLFVMPANVFLKYTNSFIKQLYLLIPRKVEQMVDEIINNLNSGKTTLQKNSIWLRGFTWIFSKMESFGARYMGKYYHISKECNHCQICIKNCPTENIFMVDGKIKFRKKCIICMRCGYICPKNAIQNIFLKIFYLKKGYSQKENMEILQNSNIQPTFITQNTKGFFKHFQRYCFEK